MLMIDICLIIHQIIVMRHLIFLIVILFSLILVSCSSESTPEEQLIGSWSGQLLQDDYGFFQTDITFTKISTEETEATISYGINDKSQCNNDIYFCDLPSQACSASWTYLGFNGGVYSFSEQPIGDVCAPGMITLRLQSDNELAYRFVGTEDALITGSGTLERR